MENKELIEKIVTVLANEFEVDSSTITPEAPIKETLHLDSLSLVDMVCLIEDEFGVVIDQNEIPTIKTFKDLFEYVSAKQ